MALYTPLNLDYVVEMSENGGDVLSGFVIVIIQQSRPWTTEAEADWENLAIPIVLRVPEQECPVQCGGRYSPYVASRVEGAKKGHIIQYNGWG